MPTNTIRGDHVPALWHATGPGFANSLAGAAFSPVNDFKNVIHSPHFAD